MVWYLVYNFEKYAKTFIRAVVSKFSLKVAIARTVDDNMS